MYASSTEATILLPFFGQFLREIRGIAVAQDALGFRRQALLICPACRELQAFSFSSPIPLGSVRSDILQRSRRVSRLVSRRGSQLAVDRSGCPVERTTRCACFIGWLWWAQQFSRPPRPQLKTTIRVTPSVFSRGTIRASSSSAAAIRRWISAGRPLRDSQPCAWRTHIGGDRRVTTSDDGKRHLSVALPGVSLASCRLRMMASCP